MEEKNEIENYLKNMYEFYKENNYHFFVEKCLSYNIKIGEYNKSINNLSKKIYDSLLNSLIEIDGICEYRELKSFYYLKISYNKSNIINNNVIVDIPIFEENYEEVVNIIYKYLIDNKFSFIMKFYKNLKNSFFKIEFENFGEFKRFSDFFNMNLEIKKIIKSRCIPFLNKINLLGVYTEIVPFSFINFYIKNLYLYFDYLDKNIKYDIVSLNGFSLYIFNRFKICGDLNEKRMYKILIDYLDISINNKDLSYLFDFNTIMDLSSYSSNDYLLKLDNDNMIYFIIKDTGEEIRYGDDDFLNIVYSKYYENVIKKETSNKFYYDFINIYSELLSTNYKTIDSILSLLNEKMDIINRLLVVLSSAFFAHKKLNIPIKVIYSILDKVIPNVYDYNNFEPKENNNLSERVLSDELINKIIDLKDGTKLTFNDYLSKYDILNNINSNTIVHLKTGEVLNGIDFVNNLYKYVSNYNSFGELFEDLVSLVEYK